MCSHLNTMLVALVLISPLSLLHADDKPADLLQQARSFAEKGQFEEALKLADRAVTLAPKDPAGYYLRGQLHERLRASEKAVADYTRVIELNPKLADSYDRRGSEQFKLGRIKESISDFDKYLELKPEQTPWHWKRGISYYYAGRYDDGRKQFEGYQTVDSNDVENAVWRYLCMARSVGVEKARADLLKIGEDRRVPMRQVYELFAGRMKPEDVLAAAKAGEPKADELKQRLFYAHLYLGLFFEAQGDAAKAREHLTKAAREHQIGHYMGDVARVHVERLKQ